MSAVATWVTLLGVAVPLITLAGSAAAYVVKLFQDARYKQRNNFFELMKIIDGPGSIAQKVLAVYELRTFPEHRDFIIRFCNNQRANIQGAASQILAAEMDATREFMEHR